MTTPNINNTLLALLLALKDLETPLSDTAQSNLSQVAEQLAANPKAWEVLIEPRLLEMIQANEALNKKFQVVKSQLDDLGDNIPLNLLPTETELEQVVPVRKTQPITRALLQVSPSDFKNNEISNMAIRVMSTPNPSETTKNLSGLDRLNEFLKQHISGK